MPTKKAATKIAADEKTAQKKTKRKTSPARRAVRKAAVSAAAAMPAFVPPITGYKSFTATAVSWFMGAMSLLGLIDELKWVKIEKGLKTWIDYDTSIVAKVTKFLFGWIDLYWLKVTTLEGHVIVLATLFVLATIRAGFKSNSRRADTVKASTAIGIVLWLPILFLSIVLVEPYSLFMCAAWFAILGSFVLFGPRTNPKGEVFPLAEKHEVGHELAGILGLAFILVAGSRMFT